MPLGEDDVPRFQRDVQGILSRQENHRLAASVLEKRMRSLGWNGWDRIGPFVQLCRDAGLYYYEGVGRQNNRTHFIAIHAKPRNEPDYFRGVGWVIEVADGEWVNRSHPVKTTKLRASARVWATRGGVLGYSEKHKHPSDCIKSTKDRDDGPTLLAETE